MRDRPPRWRPVAAALAESPFVSCPAARTCAALRKTTAVLLPLVTGGGAMAVEERVKAGPPVALSRFSSAPARERGEARLGRSQPASKKDLRPLPGVH